jgi:hypothetical protein
VTRTRQTFAVFGFASTHTALDAEALLDDMGIDVVPIPTPSTIGELCGIALRVPLEQSERALRYLQNAELVPSANVEIDDY